MSTSNTDPARFFGGGGTLTEGHECDGAPPARVKVDGTYIPVINDGVRTEIRKDGAMGITRHSEVYFPREWNDTEYTRTVEALDPNSLNVYDPVDIEYRDYANEGDEPLYRIAHRGFVMGVGGGGRGDIERRMTVGDPGQLLSAMPIKATYEYGTPFTTLIDDILDRMRDGDVVPTVFSSVEFSPADGFVTEQFAQQRDGFRDEFTFTRPSPTSIVGQVTILGWLEIAAELGATATETQFEATTHTAADALEWIEEQVEGIFFFEPDPDSETGIRLVYDRGKHDEHTAQHIDTDTDGPRVRVFKNNALHEIRPTNSYTVIGETDTGLIFNRRDNEYPEATAEHEPLLERAGGVRLEPPHDRKDGITTERGAAEYAKQQLLEELNAASLGKIEMAPAPLITPYSIIRSRPACGAAAEDTLPFEYEVEEVVHTARANADNDERYHVTSVRCSVPAREEDITVETEIRTVDEVDIPNRPIEMPAPQSAPGVGEEVGDDG